MGPLPLALLACSVVHLAAGSEAPAVQTNLGKFKGHYLSTLGGRQISAFNGIRYAKTPIRFKEAEKIDVHDDLYDATKEGDDCLQISHVWNKYSAAESVNAKMVGSEDCLFLNVYTPNVKPEKPYPVMVWIHGGGYMIGTGARNWHGPELLLDKDVILVTLNYRLGVFGFLSYDDDVFPGNLGLKDQVLALQWVKENIAAFGGDPGSVTIFGESAGGASVHLQMHSPRSKGLFQRAISQSGTLDCSWSTTTKSKAKALALKVASFLKCPTDPDSLLKCLQEKTTEELIDADASVKQTKVKVEMLFKPVMEVKKGGFITEKDLEKRSKIPWMAGLTSGEGIIMYLELAAAGDRNLTYFNKNYHKLMSGLIEYETHPHAEKITKLIKHNYLGDKDFSLSTIKQFINLFTDSLFLQGHLDSAKKHRGDHYLYLLTHEGQRSLTVLIQAQDMGLGVSHGDDVNYLFPVTKLFPKLEFNEADRKLVNVMTEAWTNFATHGDPTPNKSGPQWYESERGKLYVTISSNGLELSKHLYSSRYNFWENLPTNLRQYHDAKDEL